MTVENPEDSHLLKITVTNADPELAKKIANTMASVVAERIRKLWILISQMFWKVQ